MNDQHRTEENNTMRTLLETVIAERDNATPGTLFDLDTLTVMLKNIRAKIIQTQNKTTRR